MSKSKDIGTAAETAVVKVLRVHGFPYAERRALHGAIDLGDITGTPGITWEVKGGEAAKDASDNQIGEWWTEARVEALNAGARFGFLIVARRYRNPRDWWAVLDVADLASMLTDSTDVGATSMFCRITLVQLCELLQASGWAGGGTHAAA